MKILTGLPELLDLPTSIADDVISHIHQPFDDAEQASQYWQVYSCALVIIEASDESKAWVLMPPSTREQVLYALEYPEYIDAIGQYELSLAITNDEGGGVYLLCHTSIDQTKLKEVLTNANHLNQ
ncbi:hypothetical protein [Vibrio mexicanus]|uniref:hypothetical protein n=1 Tax=Vibrio mexicanus TaxID=1004326 RepID=UPI00063CEE81|nr:hypothetical protein [Vibrio mexicanus]